MKEISYCIPPENKGFLLRQLFLEDPKSLNGREVLLDRKVRKIRRVQVEEEDIRFKVDHFSFSFLKMFEQLDRRIKLTNSEFQPKSLPDIVTFLQDNDCKRCDTCRHVEYVGEKNQQCGVNHSDDFLCSLCNNKFQECPNCQVMTELQDGCNFMKCKNCQTRFCWLCREILEAKDHFDHYNERDPFGKFCANNTQH